MGLSRLMITLTSAVIAIEWEGLLVDQQQNDLHLGTTEDLRGNLAVFRDV